MPELPEVETVKNGLRGLVIRRRIVGGETSGLPLRTPVPDNLVQALTGATITDVRRRAKYLIFDTDNGVSLLAHLGMSGHFSVEARRARGGLGRNEHALFAFEDGSALVYKDHRRFGVLDLTQNDEHPALRKLGPEPFSPEFTAEHLLNVLRRKRTPIKVALLDQGLISGIGNIYASEILHAAGVSPKRQGGSLNEAEAELIRKHTVRILREAISSGGSSIRDYRNASGEAGGFQDRHLVYGKEGRPCRKGACGGVIERFEQAGRSTFHCPECQK